jgi:hypothetical protein
VTRPTVKILLVGCAAAVAAMAGTSIIHAHKAVTSKYTYNDDVFPILKAKCGACHVEGGVAPMSLMTYQDAFPWGESIRAELIAMHMPPWNAEGGYGEFKHPQTLTPMEIDTILTWATGGNPEGDRSKTPPAVTRDASWPLGNPDTAIKLPESVTLPADKSEDTHEFTVALKNAQPRWVRAIDLLPDASVMVRRATIALKGADGKPGTVITDWVPGGTLVPAEGSAAFLLPANAELSVSVYYKKTWMYDGQAISDQSSIGIYDAAAGKHQALQPITFASKPLSGEDTVAFDTTLEHDVDVFAVTPGHVPPHGAMQVEAVLPDGSHVPLIRLNTRPGWVRRYWFAKPISLPQGSTITASTNIETPFTLPMPDLLAPPEPPMSNDPLTLTLDVTPHGMAQSSGQ